MELEMDCLISRRLLQKICSSQVHMMAGQNKCKEKVPNVSDPNQNVETTCNSKVKFI